MIEQSDTLSITLRFGSWTLPITVRREEEYVYRQAEKLVRERFNYYTSNFPGQNTEMYLVMTILDIALLVRKQENTTETEPIISRLEPLLAKLESALRKNN